jgi:hypothetical protein
MNTYITVHVEGHLAVSFVPPPLLPSFYCFLVQHIDFLRAKLNTEIKAKQKEKLAALKSKEKINLN